MFGTLYQIFKNVGRSFPFTIVVTDGSTRTIIARMGNGEFIDSFGCSYDPHQGGYECRIEPQKKAAVKLIQAVEKELDKRADKFLTACLKEFKEPSRPEGCTCSAGRYGFPIHQGWCSYGRKNSD